MKNLKIYKSALALLTSASILLFSGCTGSKEETKKQSEPCTHLTIYFGDEPITFKECEGYEIDFSCYSNGHISYNVEKDGQQIVDDGDTDRYNYFDVYHDVADEMFENESIQKSK